MTARTETHHGGDLAAAAARFGNPGADWIDLSTGINPWPWPVGAADLAALARLPDRGQIERLGAAAASAYGTGPDVRIVAAPGTQSLIQWLPRLRPPGRVAVVSPTYGEHAAAWKLAGHDVAQVASLSEIGDADVAVVARPNNPDGRSAGRDEVRSLGSALAARGGLLVVDEAFADVGDEPSVATAEIVVLRSFGKFYGLPGLRLGFALAGAEPADRLARALGPWPVSSLAAEVGARALSDAAWQAGMRARLKAAAVRLDALLVSAGFRIVGGTDLFRLAAHDGASGVFDRLGRAGIYVRHFPENSRWLRFGLPADEPAWRRLERALAP